MITENYVHTKQGVEVFWKRKVAVVYESREGENSGWKANGSTI